MKGSVKSQLNYADIHQSPAVKCFFHKILRLLSGVTNEGSHSPGGLTALEMSPFYITRARGALRAPSCAPKLLSGALIPRTVQGTCSMGSNFPARLLSLLTSRS